MVGTGLIVFSSVESELKKVEAFCKYELSRLQGVKRPLQWDLDIFSLEPFKLGEVNRQNLVHSCISYHLGYRK